MFRRLLPKKDIFFRQMESAADKPVEIVAEFRALLEAPHDTAARVAEMKRIEREADQIVHRILSDLQQSFVTPLDRNDISNISQRIDDVVDLVEEAGLCMLHYDLREATAPLLQLSEILSRQVALVRRAVGGLSDLRHAEPLREALVEIHTLENEADDVLWPAIAELFREEDDPRIILKWKEVYETMEEATDRCEDVAAITENVLLDYA